MEYHFESVIREALVQMIGKAFYCQFFVFEFALIDITVTAFAECLSLKMSRTDVFNIEYANIWKEKMPDTNLNNNKLIIFGVSNNFD